MVRLVCIRVGDPHQIGTGHRQQVRGSVPLLLPPPVEVPRRDHFCRDAVVVELVDLSVGDHQVAPTGALLHLGDLGPHPDVVGEEVMAGSPLAIHQRVPDEHLPGLDRIHCRIADLTTGNQRQTVERHPLEGQNCTPLGIPVRFAVAALHQMPGYSLNGVGFDPRGYPSVQPAGLHQVGHHNPARRAAGQHRTGSQDESGAPGSGVFTGVAFAQTDVGQQSGDQRRVHPRRIRGFGVAGLPDSDITGDASQLPGQVLPFPDPQVVQELFAALPPERTAGQCFPLPT